MKRDEFIAAWNDAEGLKDFLKKTGYSYNTAVELASRYRRQGEQLHYWNVAKPEPEPKPRATEPTVAVDAETIEAMLRDESMAGFRRF